MFSVAVLFYKEPARCRQHIAVDEEFLVPMFYEDILNQGALYFSS